MKKATIINDEVNVFSEPKRESQIIKRLKKNEYVNYVRVKNRNGVDWLEIILPSDRKGYVELENTFKWVATKVSATYLRFMIEDLENGEMKKEILKNREKVYIILPEEIDSNSKKIATIQDSKNRIGKVRMDFLMQTKEWVDFAIAVFVASILSLYVVYYGVMAMLSGGVIFYSGLILVVLVFIWKVIVAIIFVTLDFIHKAIYKMLIRL